MLSAAIGESPAPPALRLHLASPRPQRLAPTRAERHPQSSSSGVTRAPHRSARQQQQQQQLEAPAWWRCRDSLRYSGSSATRAAPAVPPGAPLRATSQSNFCHTLPSAAAAGAGADRAARLGWHRQVCTAKSSRWAAACRHTAPTRPNRLGNHETRAPSARMRSQGGPSQTHPAGRRRLRRRAWGLQTWWCCASRSPAGCPPPQRLRAQAARGRNAFVCTVRRCAMLLACCTARPSSVHSLQ